VVLGVAALGWGVYVYLYPRPAPAPPGPAAASSTGGYHSPTGSPSPTARKSERAEPVQRRAESGPGVASEVGSWWRNSTNQLARGRHEQAWWKPTLSFLFLMAFVLLTSRGLARQMLLVPLVSSAFVWYYWPSLTWVGVTLAVVGAVLAFGISAFEFSLAHEEVLGGEAGTDDTTADR
jgi:hypothetical protein